MKDKKFKVVFTPKRYPLIFDFTANTHGYQMVEALKKRLGAASSRPLTEKEDAEFLRGMASVFGLCYADNLLQLVLQNNSVEMTIEDEDITEYKEQ